MNANRMQFERSLDEFIDKAALLEADPAWDGTTHATDMANLELLAEEVYERAHLIVRTSEDPLEVSDVHEGLQASWELVAELPSDDARAIAEQVMEYTVQAGESEAPDVNSIGDYVEEQSGELAEQVDARVDMVAEEIAAKWAAIKQELGMN